MATASSPSKIARVNPPAPGKAMFGCGSLLAYNTLDRGLVLASVANVLCPRL